MVDGNGSDDRAASRRPQAADDPIAAIRAGLEAALDQAFPDAVVGPRPLVEACRYALLAPAKRVRGILACLAARQFGVPAARAHAPAVAIEMVHAASLILDDLPCMDDALLRRGRQATHRLYGEATAMLAAIGLMNHASLHLSRAVELPAAIRLRLVEDLATAIGPDGLVGGQLDDLVGIDASPAAIEAIHRRKTGVLFSLAASAGARAAGATADTVACMHDFGAALGLAFQGYDDLLDVSASPLAAGKDVGKDSGKATLVSLIGKDAARAAARRQVDQALAHLVTAGGDSALTRCYVEGLVATLEARTTAR